mmetsp:Transcript_119389/g.338546  ORF Transcript_119389/g.338546 Transcript_119389/m.338546 type:complete len:235 (+) Transcript_119389:429-1133(+)
MPTTPRTVIWFFITITTSGITAVIRSTLLTFSSNFVMPPSPTSLTKSSDHEASWSCAILAWVQSRSRSVRPPSARMQSAMSGSSPSATAMTSRAKSLRTLPGMRWACPQSISPTRPSSQSIRLPGCGSPFTKPPLKIKCPCTLSRVSASSFRLGTRTWMGFCPFLLRHSDRLPMDRMMSRALLYTYRASMVRFIRLISSGVMLCMSDTIWSGVLPSALAISRTFCSPQWVKDLP